MCTQSVHLYQPTFFFIYMIFLLHQSSSFSHVLISREEYQKLKSMEKSSPYLFIRGICYSVICFFIYQKQNRCQELDKTILITLRIWASWSVTITFGANPCMYLSHFFKNQTNVSLYSSASNAQPNKIACWWWCTLVNGAKSRFK